MSVKRDAQNGRDGFLDLIFEMNRSNGEPRVESIEMEKWELEACPDGKVKSLKMYARTLE